MNSITDITENGIAECYLPHIAFLMKHGDIKCYSSLNSTYSPQIVSCVFREIGSEMAKK